MDGEILPYNSEQNGFVHLTECKPVARLFREQGANAKSWPCFVVFDLLLANDELLTGHPYETRRNRLAQVIRENPTHVQLLPYYIVRERDETARFNLVMEALDKIILEDEEGLVVKSLSSPYMLGESGRQKGYWVKVKPDYVNGLQNQMDCIILGGYLPEGKARMASGDRNDPSAFLVGLACDPKVCLLFFCLLTYMYIYILFMSRVAA